MFAVSKNEGKSFCDEVVIAGVTIMAQGFEYTGGDVRATRIEHGVVIGKRDFREHLIVDVAVESGPAAVAILQCE